MPNPYDKLCQTPQLCRFGRSGIVHQRAAHFVISPSPNITDSTHADVLFLTGKQRSVRHHGPLVPLQHPVTGVTARRIGDPVVPRCRGEPPLIPCLRPTFSRLARIPARRRRAREVCCRLQGSCLVRLRILFRLRSFLTVKAYNALNTAIPSCGGIGRSVTDLCNRSRTPTFPPRYITSNASHMAQHAGKYSS